MVDSLCTQSYTASYFYRFSPLQPSSRFSPPSLLSLSPLLSFQRRSYKDNGGLPRTKSSTNGGHPPGTVRLNSFSLLSFCFIFCNPVRSMLLSYVSTFSSTLFFVSNAGDVGLP
ncbi:unnamed protein product [Cuscuta epithymum]|uniref:Transmembrane protein n=1 Tax=Cuscuta epithymum TaxID=186058 RepID=A0AAV0DZ99_9ASTE|nr:unnamed protein product [Cuscuta epithymum]